jgi:hypothetical protein
MSQEVISVVASARPWGLINWRSENLSNNVKITNIRLAIHVNMNVNRLLQFGPKNINLI